MNHCKLHLVLFNLGILLFVRCAWSPALFHAYSPVQELQKDLDSLFSDPSFSSAFWGVAVQSLHTGEYLYLHNEHKLFVPGSNVKLFTTAAALLTLGPDYRFKTTLAYKGQIMDSVLTGDLFLQGAGDPTLYSDAFSDSTKGIFECFADSLQSLGIRSFDGHIIGDDSAFEDERWGVGWSWDYLDREYAAPIGALALHENCFEVLICPGDSVGALAVVHVNPDAEACALINRVVTSDSPGISQIRIHRPLYGEEAYLEGHICAGAEPVIKKIAVTDPTRFFVSCFHHYIKQKLVFQERIQDSRDQEISVAAPDSVSRVSSYLSPPLWQIIRVVNQQSQNLYAELLLRAIAHHAGETGSALNGIKIMKKTIAQLGIDSTEAMLVDGSGLSRKNTVTPLSITSLLRVMRSQTAYYLSLPVAGVDGTLEARMTDAAAYGNVRAKTGTLDQVKALSGYVLTADKEELVFAILINHFTASTESVNATQDAVCNRLAIFSRSAKHRDDAGSWRN